MLSKTTRRGLVAGIAGAVLAPAVLRAESDSYPERPVRFIIPSAPGGSPDILTRLLVDRMAKNTGRQFVVDYRPGGGTSVASLYVSRQPADGYTIYYTGPSFTVTPAVNRHFARSLDIRAAFAPVTMAAAAPFLVVVNPSLPARSFAELIAWLRANPGLANYAANAATTPHLLMEQLRQQLGLDYTAVGFGGEAEGIQAVLTGRVHMMLAIIGPAKPHIDSGTLRVLATIGSKRHRALPEVPTIPETGVAPQFEPADIWLGYVAPAGTPDTAIRWLQREISRAVRHPDLHAVLVEQQGFEPVGSDPEAFRAAILRDLNRYSQVAATAGLQTN
ncbi:Bug family tripartite tricarboxylate transporter substrate binding protein [Belnapia moabensis]|uniref:Bug family tripartite tricarboxylate transporter substrate binding protein n=1 Tax=Belnapia moabensis TaxID=365533 RepID=UPI0005B92A1F|nr:tripartite tricarboxylate transporter substrate binding protein [Belnapia moabensis]